MTDDCGAPPTEHEIRQRLADLMCPFCDAGPFVAPAMHVSRKHGIRTRELRDMAGLTWTKDSIADPGYRARKADMGREKFRLGEAKLPGRRPETPYRVSAAGRERIRSSRLGKSPTPESLRMAAAARSAASEARASARIAEWELLPQTWSSFLEFAKSQGVKPRSLAHYMRRDGASIPDGRTGRALRDVRIRGDVLRSHCESLGYSQRQLARISGVPQSAISDIQSGKRRAVSVGTLAALAEALGLDPASLTADGPGQSSAEKASPRSNESHG